MQRLRTCDIEVAQIYFFWKSMNLIGERTDMRKATLRFDNCLVIFRPRLCVAA